MISSHGKRWPLLWLHNKSRLSQRKSVKSEMVWYFIGVYIINRTLHGRLEIQNFSSCVEEVFFNTRWEILYFRAAMYQGFWYFARSWTREIQVFPRNPAKFPPKREIPRNPPKYFQILVGKTYLILILAIRPVLFTPNVQIYLETSSLQRVNNVPKLPGVLRLMMRKTGH